MTAETSNARWVVDDGTVLVRLHRPEGYDDVHPQLVLEDAGIHPDFRAELAAPPQPADAEPKTLPVPTRVYLTDKAAVIVGDPQRGWDEEGPDAHNCDAMGCATIGPHVLARVPFTDERALSQHPAPPSAPVGVDMERFREPVVLWGKAYEYDRHGRKAVVERRKPIVDELLAIIDAALAQQSAAVDEAYPTPRNRAEAAALARLALAHLGVIDAHIDAAIARCETNSAAQHQEPKS